jgi:hypothetical protein
MNSYSDMMVVNQWHTSHDVWHSLAPAGTDCASLFTHIPLNAGHFIDSHIALTDIINGSGEGFNEFAHSPDFIHSGEYHDIFISLAGGAAVGANEILINLPVHHTWDKCRWYSLDVAAADEFEFNTALINEINVTVNGLYRGSSELYGDIETVNHCHFDPELSVTRLNINLVFGHAGTGNDGSIVSYNFAVKDAIAGKNSPMAFSFGADRELEDRGDIEDAEDREDGAGKCAARRAPGSNNMRRNGAGGLPSVATGLFQQPQILATRIFSRLAASQQSPVTKK